MANDTNINTITNTNRVDPKSGFDLQTKIFHSIRPAVPLPPPSQPLSLASYALSLCRSSTATADDPDFLSTTPVLIDHSTGRHMSYSLFLRQIRSLSLSLLRLFSLSRRHTTTAFILPPSSLHVPVLYFSLLSLGVIVSPANPLSSASEIAHQISIVRPDFAFATSATAGKLPKDLRTILIDSPEFHSMLENDDGEAENDVVSSSVEWPEVRQSDVAAILFSSGTTGRVKGVVLTHRNFNAVVAGFHSQRLRLKQSTAAEPEPHPVRLVILPLFHVFGFFTAVMAVAMVETMVVMERFDFEGMLRAVERYGVTYMPVSPPLVVALTKPKVVGRYNLSSLRRLACGEAPLGKQVVERFNQKFPNVEIMQGYGMTETAGAGARMVEAEETKRFASVGKLTENMEAKIVDPVTGEALPPGHKGELWLRGPTIMKGYLGDDKATTETFDSEGWLKTGDLCLFDSEGFLYILDRLKELIKYKAYQVPPAELEHLLQSHPNVIDAAVIPYPNEEAGEIPMAYVVRKPGSNISEAQVMDFVAKKVAPYKKVRRVAFINAIPKSPAGKILRRELINHASSSGTTKL